MPTANATVAVGTAVALSPAVAAFPSWLPHDPAGWPLFGTEYKAMAPRQWPEDLYDDEDGNARKDQQAFGRALSLVRRATHWFVTRLWPHRDTTGEYWADWEEVFAVAPAATDALRQDRLIAALRNRGTLTDLRLRTMFAPVFGESDPATVTIVSPDLDSIPAGATANDHAQLQTQLHIYHAAETADIDRQMADQFLARVVPMGDTWSAGRFLRFKWDTAGSGWDISTWGP